MPSNTPMNRPAVQRLVQRMRRTVLLQMLVLGAGGAWAQDSAQAPVKIVVPYSAGGVTDQIARLLADRMAPLLKQTFIVENRPGGGGRLGVDAVMKSSPDGATLLMANTSYSIQPVADPSAKYDPVTSLAPIGIVGTYGLAVVTGRQVPANSLGEFIAYAKRNPGKLSYGSSGMGSGSHFLGEYIKWLNGIYMVHVPYRSTSAALNDVVGGVVDLAFDATAKPYADAGKVKILAVTGRQRDPRLPNVPTVAEAGFKEMTVVSWSGLLAPANTPPATIERLNKALNTALNDETLRKSLRDMGIVPQAVTPAEMKEQIRQEYAFHRKIAVDAKLKFE